MSVDLAVADYGRAMGLPELSLQPSGQVRLGLPSGDWLSLEQTRDALLVNAVFQLPYLPASAMLLALQACDLRRPELDAALQVGLRGSGSDSCLLVLARLSDLRRISGDDIARTVDSILRWYQRFQSEASIGQTGG